MKNKFIIFLISYILVLIYHPLSAQEKTTSNTFGRLELSQVDFPEYKGEINDYNELFTKTQQDELSSIIKNYYIKSTKKIVIVTVDSISPYKNILKFAKDLKKDWKITSNQPQHTLTIVVCKPTQQIAMVTGEGVGDVLTNEFCQEIISEKMIPEFKKEHFYEGIKNGLLALIEQWDLE